MKTWHLVVPEWSEYDTIWHSPLPFVLWPVCEKTLLTYWLDEAVRRGIGPSSSDQTLAGGKGALVAFN